MKLIAKPQSLGVEVDASEREEPYTDDDEVWRYAPVGE